MKILSQRGETKTEKTLVASQGAIQQKAFEGLWGIGSCGLYIPNARGRCFSKLRQKSSSKRESKRRKTKKSWSLDAFRIKRQTSP